MMEWPLSVLILCILFVCLFLSDCILLKQRAILKVCRKWLYLHIHLTFDNLYRAVIFTSFSFLSFSLQSKGYTRGVTKPQFARMLHFLSITVQPQDLAVSHSFPFYYHFAST